MASYLKSSYVFICMCSYIYILCICLLFKFTSTFFIWMVTPQPWYSCFAALYVCSWCFLKFSFFPLLLCLYKKLFRELLKFEINFLTIIRLDHHTNFYSDSKCINIFEIPRYHALLSVISRYKLLLTMYIYNQIFIIATVLYL